MLKLENKQLNGLKILKNKVVNIKNEFQKLDFDDVDDNNEAGDKLTNLNGDFSDLLNYVINSDDKDISDYGDELDDVVESDYWEYGFDDVTDSADLTMTEIGESNHDLDDWHLEIEITMLNGCKDIYENGFNYCQFVNGNSAGDGKLEPLDKEDVNDYLDELLDVINDGLD